MTNVKLHGDPASPSAQAEAASTATRRKLRSQTVYDRLRRDISGHRLVPGTVLQEEALSARYEASRTPVREALFRLEQEGFVHKVGRQLRVKDFSLAEVENLYQLREALEKMAVRLCIERASDTQLVSLARQLDVYETIDPRTDFELSNEQANEFHRSLARLCGNPMICQELISIQDKVLMISARWLSWTSTFEEARREHRQILRAIQARDVTVAEAAVRAHIQGVIELCRQGTGAAPPTEAGD